nr:NADH dehydrogenase [ubiquinone] 1 alpha subcomplex assembly factor 8 isoform X1 [Nothobranchius furzeri]
MTNNIFHHSLIQQHKGLLCCCLMRNMSGSNNVWSRNRERLRLFSEVFAQCADEVSSHKGRFRGFRPPAVKRKVNGVWEVCSSYDDRQTGAEEGPVCSRVPGTKDLLHPRRQEKN